MKSLYKIIIIFGITIFSVCLLLIFSFVIYITYRMPFNNYYLKTFQSNFRQSIKSFHPARSILIAEIAEVGNWGNSNHCDFFVGEFRSSSLLKEELMKNYPDDFLTAGVYFVADNESFLDSPWSNSPWSDWIEKYLKNYEPKENEIVYLVWAADDDNPPDGDIRCN